MIVGFIITPFVSDEVSKNELVEITDTRPWLSSVPSKFMVQIGDKKYVGDDISIAYYVKTYTQHNVKIISPLEEDADKKVLSCDICFLIIFDLLEAFHTLPSRLFQKVRKLFIMPNVYPSYSYQHFVNHKNIYYDYLKVNGVNIIPNLYISAKDFENNREDCIKRVTHMEPGDDGKIIGKPMLGQERIDFQVFYPKFTSERFEQYLEKMFKSYDGILFQPYIKNLDKNFEYKVMFIGNEVEYAVMVKNEVNDDVFVDIHDESFQETLQYAKFAFSKLPPITFNGKEVSRLMTRIDLSCCHGEDRFFVSEIEFVPSLFLPNIEKNMNIQVDALLGQQVEKILEEIKDTVHIKRQIVPNITWIYALYAIITLIILACIFVVYKYIAFKK